MAPKFGTSGLRGLVTELTPDLVADYLRAFLAACPTGTGLWVGRDLRASSPALARAVMDAAQAEGVAVVDCGDVPTPALALGAMQAGAAAIMVTGSHIPADRNGLKFYVPTGEITKTDEAAILQNLGRAAAGRTATITLAPQVGAEWVTRYLAAFGPSALAGLRIGVWSHSAVSRDLLLRAVQGLGAEAVELGRSAVFIPVDTEAVPEDIRAQLAAWVTEHQLDAILSTDGDGDRPLLVDDRGHVVPGDVLGQITAAALAAETVVTPVSSNSGADLSGAFHRVIRTRIGSPFVIAAMAGTPRVVGYEANGGFLLGFAAQGPAGTLAPLATRDSLLPLVATLAEARRVGSVSQRVAQEPARFTAADRLENIPTAASAAFLSALAADAAQVDAFLASLGEALAATDRTDGLRFCLTSGRVLHLRPSGNAPEFRVYTEAEAPQAAETLMRAAFAALQTKLTPAG